MKIYLVENENQISHIDKDALTVAFYPDIYVALLKQGYNVKKSSDFFLKEEHFEVSKKSYEITQKLFIQLKEKKIFSSKAALNMFEFYIKLLFGHGYMLDVIVRNIKQKYKDAKIIVAKNTLKVDLYANPTITTNDTFLALFLNEDVKKSYVKNLSFINNIINSIAELSIKKYNSFIVTSFLNSNMREYFKNEKTLQLRLADKPQIKELLYNLINYIKKRDVITISTNYSLKNIEFKLSSNEQQIFDILKFKVDNIIAYISRVENSKDILHDLFKGKDYKIVSLLNIGILPFFAELSKQDSYLVSHGSHIKQDGLSGIEQDYLSKGQLVSDSFKFKVVQSPYAVDFFKDNDNIIKSYPLAWGNKFEPEPTNKVDNKILILHASTPKVQLRPIIYETQFEYIDSIIKISKLIQNMKDVELLIRFRNSINLSEDSLKFLLKDYKKVKIVSNNTFNYWLDKSDILVSYSSTTIEEAILNGKKVIQFGDIYRHLSCIPWAKNINELKNMILNYENLEYNCKSFYNLNRLSLLVKDNIY